MNWSTCGVVPNMKGLIVWVSHARHEMIRAAKDTLHCMHIKIFDPLFFYRMSPKRLDTLVLKSGLLQFGKQCVNSPRLKRNIVRLQKGKSRIKSQMQGFTSLGECLLLWTDKIPFLSLESAYIIKSVFKLH